MEDAYQAFSKLLEFYDQVKNNKVGIEQPSVISSGGWGYGDNFYLGVSKLHRNKCYHSNNVKIYPNCFIGDNVTIGT